MKDMEKLIAIMKSLNFSVVEFDGEKVIFYDGPDRYRFEWFAPPITHVYKQIYIAMHIVKDGASGPFKLSIKGIN